VAGSNSEQEECSRGLEYSFGQQDESDCAMLAVSGREELALGHILSEQFQKTVVAFSIPKFEASW
jgi:hypothetical protein